MTTTTDVAADPVGALADRIFGESLGAFHQFTVYLGVRLGLFRALAEHPDITCQDLAAGAGIDARYALEWVQAEVIAGLLTADATDYSTAHLRLAPGVVETLVDETSPAYVGAMSQAIVAVGTAATPLLDAYRIGAGLPASAYGPEMVPAQAAFNRPAYVNELAASWLVQMPDVDARLKERSRRARVADVGCGCGWAAIELAKAYPHISVDGYDADEESVLQARRNAMDHGVSDRVHFHVVDAATTAYGDGDYDVVFFFECVHDFGRPVEALTAARAAVSDDGFVIVMDERAADLPQVGDPMESFFASVSATWCLPQSRVVPDCEAPGTVMRPATLEAFARRAGWSGIEVLPIEHAVFRFYRLAA